MRENGMADAGGVQELFEKEEVTLVVLVLRNIS